MNVTINIGTTADMESQLRLSAPKRGVYVITPDDSPFFATKKMFSNHLNYTRPISYDRWAALDPDDKAACLFVQFFDQIVLAWRKLRTPAAIEEECLEEVLQYIIKNVSVLEEHPDRFNPKYLYKVAWNAIYCRAVDPYNGQTASSSWYNNTCSAYVPTEDGEVCLFDLICQDSDDIATQLAKEAFWRIVQSVVDDMGAEAAFVINNLCGADTSAPKFFGSEEHPEAGRRVSPSTRKKVTEELKSRLQRIMDEL